jgi:hypothetical protein
VRQGRVIICTCGERTLAIRSHGFLRFPSFARKKRRMENIRLISWILEAIQESSRILGKSEVVRTPIYPGGRVHICEGVMTQARNCIGRLF